MWHRCVAKTPSSSAVYVVRQQGAMTSVRRRRHRPPRPWKQAIYLWVGIALVPVGIIIAPLPGPGGIPILAVAALLIITSSKRAASWVRLHRQRWDWMHEILLKGEGWLGGDMGKALRRTNGRKNTDVVKPPASRKERILDILLFPVHVAIILTRTVARKFGLKLPGDSRKERQAARARRELERAKHRQERRAARAAAAKALSVAAEDAAAGTDALPLPGVLAEGQPGADRTDANAPAPEPDRAAS
jgi:hypothetical protein